VLITNSEGHAVHTIVPWLSDNLQFKLNFLEPFIGSVLQMREVARKDVLNVTGGFLCIWHEASKRLSAVFPNYALNCDSMRVNVVWQGKSQTILGSPQQKQVKVI